MSEAQPDAKVVFIIDEEDGTANVETLWAYSLGGDRYRLDNSPFYAYSVSWRDIVLAAFDQDEKRLKFQRVVEKSGNRTIRIAFDPPVEDGNASDEILQGLADRGCGYEGATRAYMAINIPSDVDLDTIVSFLIECDAQWEHADPTYEEVNGSGS